MPENKKKRIKRIVLGIMVLVVALIWSLPKKKEYIITPSTHDEVIFLDVDGVINSWNSQQRDFEVKLNLKTLRFDPTCLENLRVLVERTGADLILSSSWRFDDDALGAAPLINLEARLAEKGMRLAGRTGCTLAWRDDEINAWLQEHPDVESYVILDDVNDNFRGDNLRRWVATNEGIGLTSEDVQKAEKILFNGREENDD